MKKRSFKTLFLTLLSGVFISCAQGREGGVSSQSEEEDPRVELLDGVGDESGKIPQNPLTLSLDEVSQVLSYRPQLSYPVVDDRLNIVCDGGLSESLSSPIFAGLLNEDSPTEQWPDKGQKINGTLSLSAMDGLSGFLEAEKFVLTVRDRSLLDSIHFVGYRSKDEEEEFPINFNFSSKNDFQSFTAEGAGSHLYEFCLHFLNSDQWENNTICDSWDEGTQTCTLSSEEGVGELFDLNQQLCLYFEFTTSFEVPNRCDSFVNP